MDKAMEAAWKAVMGWLNDKIREQSEAAVRKFFDGDEFREIVWNIIGQMPDDAIPKDRAVFIRVMVEHLITKHRWTRNRAHEVGAFMMQELETDCAPYGDPDYGWTARDAREWATEWSEDR